jgi:hypothetical protein
VSALCAAAARERADPLAATAAMARRWLLIEHPGPWAPDALAGSGIDTTVRQAVADAATAASARVLLIRRPGRPSTAATRTWAVVHHEPSAVERGSWKQDTDLLRAAAALGRAPAGQSAQDLLLLVCAHGRHDTCCALRGRPVAAALARRWPEETWECSHVGGDRFAPNLLVLPDGACYGNLETGEAVDLVAGHLGGRLQLPRLRGLSAHPPVVQAAIIAAHEEHGPSGPRDVGCSGVEQLQPDTWRVHLTGTEPLPARVTATVTRARREPHLLTCRAASASAAWTYQVLELR